jgi:hypothetical protein
MQEPSSQRWEFDAEPNVRHIAVLLAALRVAETIGRPLGSESFLTEMAVLTGRDVRPAKREPKKKGFAKVSLNSA